MRISLFALLALVCAITALAWEQGDYEIFDLVAAVESTEGKGTSFYDFIGVDKSATNAQLTKAYRKRSLELHPDKNPGVANIHERFSRLGVVMQILRDGGRRDRYNFFLKNGVPTWKGFGYAYTRWRPGLGFVFVFLTLFTSAMQYVVQRLNHVRDTRRVAYFNDMALKSARGAAGRRKVRVPMVEGASGGESLELVVVSDEVFLPHDDGTLTPLSDLAPLPSVMRTWPIATARSLLSRVTGNRAVSEAAPTTHADAPDVDLSDADGYDVSGPDTPTPAARRARTGRAAELRQRSAANAAAANGDGGDSTDNAESASASEVDSDARRRKAGPGKAAAARRRKMGLKK